MAIVKMLEVVNKGGAFLAASFSLPAKLASNPISQVLWVPRDKVIANEYNPNSVAKNELRLLKTSVMADGYTQPIVTVWDEEGDLWVVVDGFHRSLIGDDLDVIAAWTDGYLPIVVIDKSIAERMASTVRHNRARGKHSVAGMGHLVFEMLEQGLTDEKICAEIGITIDELKRYKYVTGFAKLWENADYQRAWATRRQIQLNQEYAAAHPDEPAPPL